MRSRERTEDGPMLEKSRHDAWQAGDSYDLYMGRWSRQIAPRFLEWLDASDDLDWLEVGCGTGALSAAILAQCAPKSLIAIDQSEAQVVAGPDIVSRGFLYMDEHQDFFDECKTVVARALADCDKEGKEDWAVVKTAVRRALKKHIKNRTGRVPVILPVVLEI